MNFDGPRAVSQHFFAGASPGLKTGRGSRFFKNKSEALWQRILADPSWSASILF